MKYRATRFLASVLALALNASPVFAQGGIAGRWELTLETPQGATTATLILETDRDQVSGELTNAMGSVPVAGTFSTGNLAITANIDMQGMAMTLGFNATLEGDALSGTVKAGDFGEFPLTGKRATSETAPTAATPAPEPTAAASPAAAANWSDASGKWDIVLSISGLGEFPVSAMLKQEGTKVTGTLTSVAGEVAVNGTMTATSLKLEFMLDSPQGPLPATMTGELGGAGFTGKASIAGMGEADWKATRGN